MSPRLASPPLPRRDLAAGEVVAGQRQDVAQRAAGRADDDEVLPRLAPEATLRATAMARTIRETMAETGCCGRDALVAAGFARAEIANLFDAACAIAGMRPDLAKLPPGTAPQRLMPSGAPRRPLPRQMAFAEAMATQGLLACTSIPTS